MARMPEFEIRFKEKDLKEAEFKIKLLGLRVKYERNPMTVLTLSLEAVAIAARAASVAMQPTPKFKKGGVIVGDTRSKEIIIKKNELSKT